MYATTAECIEYYDSLEDVRYVYIFESDLPALDPKTYTPLSDTYSIEGVAYCDPGSVNLDCGYSLNSH